MTAAATTTRPRRRHVPRLLLVCAGLLLVAASPLVGLVPGPGGVIVFGVGAALLLKGSFKAKRLYVRLERWRPGFGRWMNFALRRGSPRHRRDSEAIRRNLRNKPLARWWRRVRHG